MYYVKRSY